MVAPYIHDIYHEYYTEEVTYVEAVLSMGTADGSEVLYFSNHSVEVVVIDVISSFK